MSAKALILALAVSMADWVVESTFRMTVSAAALIESAAIRMAESALFRAASDLLLQAAHIPPK